LEMEWLKNNWAQARLGDAKSRRRLLVLAAATVVAVALLVSGQNSSQPISVAVRKSGQTVSNSSGYVHLTGAVKSPGVYPITAGMRLFEVITLAGGFTPRADRSSVNLARIVNDGEQIIVSGSGVSAVSDGLIHLNKSSASDLDKLPGIGPTLAQRIIDWRSANGGFKSVDDLRKVGGIGEKLFAGIRKLVSP
jgi:competence protein ComEA